MNKYLVLTSRYLAKPLANGICANNMAKALRDNGNQVWILGTVPSKENVAVRDSYESVITFDADAVQYTFSRKCKNLLQSFTSLQRNNELVDQYINAASELVEKNSIECIIAVYFPIETSISATELKRMYPFLKVVQYELDSFGDGTLMRRFYMPLIKWRQKRSIGKLYKIMDDVIIMKSHENYFRNNFSIGEKLIISDLPVLLKPESEERNTGEIINFFYTGTIKKSHRNPEKLLNIIRMLSNENYRFHFYSRGDCEGMIREFAEQDCRIIQHGYVSVDELDKASRGVNFYLSIGNSNSNSVPSKVITSLASGRPIIHIAMQENDICESYLKRYPLACFIKSDWNIKKSVEQIERFIDKNINARISFEDIEMIFPENTPSHCAKQIENIMSAKKVYDDLKETRL